MHPDWKESQVRDFSVLVHSVFTIFHLSRIVLTWIAELVFGGF